MAYSDSLSPERAAFSFAIKRAFLMLHSTCFRMYGVTVLSVLQRRYSVVLRKLIYASVSGWYNCFGGFDILISTSINYGYGLLVL